MQVLERPRHRSRLAALGSRALDATLTRDPVEQLFPLAGRTAYRGLKAIVGGAMRRSYNVRAEGLENLPPHGPSILAANHVSFMDSLFVPLVVPRRVTYLAKAEYWDRWRTRWLVNAMGHISLRREPGADAASAMDSALRVLGAGGLLGIYPEGTRSPDGRLYRGKIGVARLAMAADCPVIPVGLAGTLALMPKDAKIPRLRGEVTVRFGAPIRVPAHALSRPIARRQFVDALMYEICGLSGQEYVDKDASRAA